MFSTPGRDGFTSSPGQGQRGSEPGSESNLWRVVFLFLSFVFKFSFLQLSVRVVYMEEVAVKCDDSHRSIRYTLPP